MPKKLEMMGTASSRKKPRHTDPAQPYLTDFLGLLDQQVSGADGSEAFRTDSHDLPLPSLGGAAEPGPSLPVAGH